MANLTKDTIHPTTPRGGRDSLTVSDGVALFAGELVGTDADGYLAKWADTAGHKFVGIMLVGATGDTGATPLPSGAVNSSGDTLTAVAVASAVQASVNSLVYSTTSNPADLTLTAGTNVEAVGYVKAFVSAGVCDVELFTPAEHLALN